MRSLLKKRPSTCEAFEVIPFISLRWRVMSRWVILISTLQESKKCCLDTSKRVHFYGKVKVILIPSVEDYRKENIHKDLWWTAVDIDNAILDFTKSTAENLYSDSSPIKSQPLISTWRWSHSHHRLYKVFKLFISTVVTFAHFWWVIYTFMSLLLQFVRLVQL